MNNFRYLPTLDFTGEERRQNVVFFFNIIAAETNLLQKNVMTNKYQLINQDLLKKVEYPIHMHIMIMYIGILGTLK